MLITKQNSLGGPGVKVYPLKFDPRTSHMGFHIGYCAGCNEPLMIAIGDVEPILERFNMDGKKFQFHFRERFIRLLGGEILEK